MPDAPHEVQLALSEFDRIRLPEAQRNLTGDAFMQAVREQLSRDFAGDKGVAEVIVTGDRIIIRWDASEELRPGSERGIELLKAGDYDLGISTLESFVRRQPGDANARLNLGMALSDKGRLIDALEHLKQVVLIFPEDSRGWVALGVARGRNKEVTEAVAAFRRAVDINPEDAYARKNLGAMLSEEEASLDEAILHLQRAIEYMPKDQQAWFALGRAYERKSEIREADDHYRQVLHINPTSQLAEMARQGLSRISERHFRETGDVRPDALAFCLDALTRFQQMSRERVQQITFEIAMLGTKGINPNNPDVRYSLKALPGSFSGLHLLCLEYAGFKILDPSVDIGFDLSKEYAQAKSINVSGN
jgi:tetratricopeptide (TPR) repeat protein